MKRRGTLLLLCLLCLGVCTACSGQEQVEGEMIGFELGEDGRLASFTVRTRSGKERDLSLTEESRVISMLEGLSGDDFLSEPQLNAGVTVYLDKGAVRDLRVWGLLERSAGTLSDGTPLDIMRSWDGSRTYQLADGTELLTVRQGYGPANSSTVGADSLDDLGETARERILTYYEEQGVLYDEAAELEQAYTLYQEQDYRGGAMLEQNVTPTASSDRMIFFTTEVTRPVWDGTHTVWQLGAAFDRETGAQIELRALFTCPEEEILESILDAAQLYDVELREEMAAAFRPEYVLLYPEHLEAAFPQGTLPSQEYAHAVVADLSGGILELLQDWAVPDGCPE